MEELDFVISCERKPIGAVGRGHAIAMRLVGMCRACVCEHKCPWREAFGGERQGGEVAGGAARGCGGGAGGVHLDRATAATPARFARFCSAVCPMPHAPTRHKAAVPSFPRRKVGPKWDRGVIFTQWGHISNPGSVAGGFTV